MKSTWCGIAVLVATAVTPLCADVIKFDDQNTSGGAVQLNQQYADSGVLFDNLFAAQQFKFNIFPPSTPNYASPFWVDNSAGFINFVDPSNPLTQGIVDSVFFTLVGLTANEAHPGSFSGATIEALDIGGNVIAGQTVVIPGVSATTANQVLTFTGAIHSIEFIHTNGTAGALPIDNLNFDSVTLPVPEPSSLALYGIGSALTLAATIRRRRSSTR